MKKTLSVIICALMLFSLTAIGVFAEGPVAISTSDDFKNMASDGDYYLAADITVSETYETAFTGKLDGKGHTITLVDCPLFVKLHDATVENLKLAGTVKGSRDLGSLAIEGYGLTIKNVTNDANVIGPEAPSENSWIGGIIGEVYSQSGHGTAEASCPSLFENVVNNGNVTMSHISKDARAGGIVGNAAKYQLVTFKNCVNNGDITYTGTLTNAYIAGIVGGSFGAEYIDCVNNGKITATNASSAGGILGRGTPSSQGGDQSQTFIRCVNNGDITSNGTAAAGIFAYVSEAKTTTTQLVKADACVNTGNVTNSGTYAGGIGGYVWANNNSGDATPRSHAEILNCVNTGVVTGTGESTWTSQFLSYTNSDLTVIKNNIGAGTATGTTADRNVIVGLSKANITNYDIANNYFLNAPVNFSFTAETDEQYKGNIIAITAAPAGSVVSVTADQLASGEVAYLANQYAGSDVFFQTLGKDRVPTTLDGHKKVILDGNSYANPSEGGTTPAPTTGDASVWFAVVGVLALFGMGIAFRTSKAN